ncbi:hypothetical protein [Lysobacter sp. P5_B9]
MGANASGLEEVFEALATVISRIATTGERELANNIWCLLIQVEESYSEGSEARQALRRVRERVALALGMRPEDSPTST